MNPVWDFLRMAVKCRPSPRYAHRFALYLLKLAAFEPFRLAERAAMRWRGEPGELPIPPLFVLGYYRSGTTHLQEVLLQDPNLAYMDFYQCFFPTAFNSTEAWVKPVFEAIITRTSFLHPAHQIPFSFDLPGEEDVALVSGAAYLAANWGQVYPRAFEELYGKTALLDGTPEEIAAFGELLHDLIWRVSKSRGHRRLVLKSPPHTGRLRLLHQLYPDARYVFIRRNPWEVYGSNLKLWRSFEDNHLHTLEPGRVREYILWSHDRAHDHYERDKALLAPGQLCEVTFEELMAAPLPVLERIYATLGLGDFDAVAPAMARYLEAHHDAEPREYDLSADDLEQIERRLGRWIDLWGYERPGARRLEASAS